MSNKSVIILAVDGGGIRGIIPAFILSQMEQMTGKSCYQMFDIIGGTSTGGIIAAALTTTNPNGIGLHPYSAGEVLDMYENEGGRIFVPQECDTEFCATYFADDGQGNGVEPYLQNQLGADTSLSLAKQVVTSLPGARVRQMFTTGYAVNSKDQCPGSPQPGVDYGPYLFNWADAAISEQDDYYVWEAARSSSAAPVFFPIAHVGGGNGVTSPASERWVVDGGVMSNNPAVWAVSEAFRTGLASSLNDIALISLGTGVYPGGAGVAIEKNSTWVDRVPRNGNWGGTPWAVFPMYDLECNLNKGRTILDVIMDSVQQVSCNQLAGLSRSGLEFYRLEPVLPQAQAAMDDISPANIQALLKYTMAYLEGAGAPVFQKILSVLQG
ncbi:patatin-like phospholipase family protein [Dinghuibacter silviterrae]|uniref:Patatin-like phospholipase/acyl hydrolase n=1 Tax=Dinghuibacter silviterrae TaxID=1539049 RepID=A0A4R8DGG4_9BACT|nr:patatin-like phospholipase family protein [Dinghuibacter silviterrae]TDW96575.1 patatin-like phospholipase/acyl hydrolase [Dinghuibacter silviterrae]